MKNIIHLFLLFITITIFAQEEESFCLTSPTSTHFVDLDVIRGLDHSNDIFNIKIYIHVLQKVGRQEEFKSGQSIEGINRILKFLYDDFDPLGIHFIWSGDINYIQNDDYYLAPDDYSEEILNSSYNHTDGIDIFLTDDLQNPIARANDIGGSSIIYGGSFAGHVFGWHKTPFSYFNTISHEMGHVLFLWHTHHGTTLDFWENFGDPNSCAELVNPITDPTNPLYEEQVSNGSLCGDYISDTPADPKIAQHVNINTCRYEPINDTTDEIPEFDANGDVFQPNTSNLMSYTSPLCFNGFSLGQKRRMKNAIWYLPVLNNAILNNYTYIRPLDNCYVCDGFTDFTIYSSYDLNTLNTVSSENVSIQIIEQTNNSLTIRVTNNDSDLPQGSRGYLSVVNNQGIILVTQPIWVGLPQTVPENTLSGSSETSSGNYKNYKIFNDNVEYRLDGIEYYAWEYPEPNESFDGPFANNPNIWEYNDFNKYVPNSASNTGNQTGFVKVAGQNPCGVGSYGVDNTICVTNLDDPEGDACDDTNNNPILYYPNPADSLLEIDLSMQDYKVFNILIYDELQTQKYSGTSTNVIKTVDMFNLLNGTYYLHIYDDNNTLVLSRTLIINH